MQGARKALESRDFTVGEQMVQEHDLKKNHPVILIPGIVSTGLESWGTEAVARPFFRKRLWVSLSGLSILVGTMLTEGHIDNDQSRHEQQVSCPLMVRPELKIGSDGCRL